MRKYESAIRKRALELAEVEKQRLSRKFNVETSDEFYRLFELDLKDFIEKTEDKQNLPLYSTLSNPVFGSAEKL
jgi:hypothetical protein